MCLPAKVARRAAAVVAAAAMSTGCSSEGPGNILPPPPPPPPVYSIDDVAWAGTHHLVQSTAPFPEGVTASLRISGETIPLAPLNATHLVAMIPETLTGGSSSAELLLDGVAHPLGDVFVAGYVGEHRYDEPIFYDAYRWPRDASASVLGFVNGVPTRVDLEANQMQAIGLPSSGGMRGPGATPDPDVFLVVVDGVLESWRFRPTLSLVERFSYIPGFGQPVSPRQAMLMSPTAMLYAPGQHRHAVFVRDDPAQPFTWDGWFLEAEETEGVYLSPRGDRATLRVDADPAGVSVFDAASGAIAYRTPLRATFGVDFSPDGSRILLGGRHVEDRNIPRLVVLDAATGAILADTTFGYTIGAVAWDEERPYIYVLLEDPGSGPILGVFDKTTLAPVALMRPPGVVESASSCCYRAVIAPSRVSDTVHLFWFRWSWRFTLPPS